MITKNREVFGIITEKLSRVCCSSYASKTHMSGASIENNNEQINIKKLLKRLC